MASPGLDRRECELFLIQSMRNLVDPIKPAPAQPVLDEETRKAVWQPLAIDPERPGFGVDPLAEFEPYDESDIAPLNEARPTWPKRDRLHRMAEDLLDWDINSIFYFRTKVDLAALAFRDYDPDNKKQNLLRYMQLNILWQWNQRHSQEVNNYCLFKYRFRLGNHKLRLLSVPQGPSTVFSLRWAWRPTEHLHFAFQTYPATEDTEGVFSYKTYFRRHVWERGSLRQHVELIANYAWPSFRLALSHEFSQDSSSVSYMHMVNPRLVLGVEAKYPRKKRPPFPVGILRPAGILTGIIRYFSWHNLFQLVTELSHQYGAVQMRASYVKDLSAVPQLHVFPRYERFLVGGTLWSNIYPSSLGGIYRGSYFALGYSYTNYWSNYNVRSTVDSEWNMKTEMSTTWMPNVDITLQLHVGGWYSMDDPVRPPTTTERLGWALGITWFT